MTVEKVSRRGLGLMPTALDRIDRILLGRWSLGTVDEL